MKELIYWEYHLHCSVYYSLLKVYLVSYSIHFLSFMEIIIFIIGSYHHYILYNLIFLKNYYLFNLIQYLLVMLNYSYLFKDFNTLNDHYLKITLQNYFCIKYQYFMNLKTHSKDWYFERMSFNNLKNMYYFIMKFFKVLQTHQCQ